MPPLLLIHGTPSTGNGSSGGVTLTFLWTQIQNSVSGFFPRELSNEVRCREPDSTLEHSGRRDESRMENRAEKENFNQSNCVTKLFR